MINRNLNVCTLFLLLLCQTCCNADASSQFQRPIYVGAIGGFGSTTWQGLVPTHNNQNSAINMSTPITVSEGGGVWGVMAGYEFTPYFALEGSYLDYSKADISFDKMSLFSFTHSGETKFTTRTETLSLMGKIMLIIPSSTTRVFSSAGIANLHRNDLIIDDWRLSPTFGLGFNFFLADHFKGEIAANYTAGFGESRLSPADTYYPFLYSVTLRLAYYL